ncbi:MAG: hypothetical protein ABI330_15370, partial [Caldimonas sp.]
DDARSAPAKNASASPSSTPLGPTVEGPEFDQLYALMSADGSSPLDRSKSKGGAADNLAGEGLAKAFGRVKKVEEEWSGRIDAVKKKASESDAELDKVKAAAKAFSARADGNDDVASQSKDYIKALHAVSEKMDDIEPLIDEADGALDDVEAATESKAVHEAGQDKEKASGELEETKEKAKEQQEMFKGALGVLGKMASPAEWGEVAVEGLLFVDEQLFAQLPKQRLEELKKRVDEATAKINLHQGKHDDAKVRSANEKLSAANKRFAAAKNALRNRVSEMGMAQRSAVKKLSHSADTAAVGKMIEEGHKMEQLMADGKKASQGYLAEAKTLHKQCESVTVLFSGFPDVVAMTPGVDPIHAKALSATATINVRTLKSWTAYLESMQQEASDSLDACGDAGKSGYMKNYNLLQTIMENMLRL